MAAGPRVLVTGFEPFPGAPVNPTEWLVARLSERPPAVAGLGAFAAAVLPVDYGRLPAALREAGRAFSPDIAIHFGLARECAGFRLERLARNRFAAARLDNSGASPVDGPICAGPDCFPSSLPLDVIHAGLTARGLPVEWSDDAGGYLCNMAFTLSAARACEGFSPTMSGFVHVPLLVQSGRDGRQGAEPFTGEKLLAGAEIVIRASVDAYLETSNGKAAPA